MAATTFRSWTSTPTINALPVIKFVSICCCWYAVGASMKEWRYSLTTLTKTSRERSWANPLPCSLLSAQHQCRGVRFATAPFRVREHEVCRMLWHCQTAAHQSRVAHQEDRSHDCGCQEDGPILPLWTVGTHAARSL